MERKWPLVGLVALAVAAWAGCDTDGSGEGLSDTLDAATLADSHGDDANEPRDSDDGDGGMPDDTGGLDIQPATDIGRDDSRGPEDTSAHDTAGAEDTPDAGPPPACSETPVGGTGIALTEVADELTAPVHVTHSGDGTRRLFVVEQTGRIVVLSAASEPSVYLDLTGRVSTGGERGLLSVAFHPAFATNGRLFVYYTDAAGDTVVAEFTVDEPLTGTPTVESETLVLAQEQPAANHNGGQIAFGPDGYLYVGLGDGGGAGDTFGNGQKPDTLLAKILRVDVDAESGPYGIPADNPFVDDASHRPETWAWGFRNPWRFSFDRETGELWAGDVGQNEWEEIDVVVAGANYGWPQAEGNHCYTEGCDLEAFTGAVWEYSHADGGVSVTGGHVYRGCRMPDLEGVYLFADFNYTDSPLWSLTWNGTTAAAGPVQLATTGALISSFGEDEEGELYVADIRGGRLLKIVPAP